jgi:hypothetical protein
LKALECFQQALMIAKANATMTTMEDDPDVLLALRNIDTVRQTKKKQKNEKRVKHIFRTKRTKTGSPVISESVISKKDVKE